jgi:hypothetical protein
MLDVENGPADHLEPKRLKRLPPQRGSDDVGVSHFAPPSSS